MACRLMPARRATTEADRPSATARGNGRRARSLPSPQAFPRDFELHRLAPEGALEAGVALAPLFELGALRLVLELLRAAGEKLLAPPMQQRLGDVALARELAIDF